jgi:CubicO group peptidase (beta-lactamase class C family)
MQFCSMKNIIKGLLISAYLLFFQANHCKGQDTIAAKTIDEIISQRLPSIAPGCVVLIANKGKVVYKKAFGTANILIKQPMQTDMIFRIGSMTKQFTAIAILQLLEKGKLSLQDTLQKFVKEFPSKQYPITIENLLTQTSGIINYQAIEHPDPLKIKEDFTPAEGVDYFKDEPLQFKPGSRFEYSNSNYYLLGYIIEIITGVPYQEYLKQHIISIADLRHTYYIDTLTNIPNITSGYSKLDGKQWENAKLQNPTHLYAAGALMSNANDLFLWHQALESGKLIENSFLAKAYTAFKLADGSKSEYGYGWFIRNLDGNGTIEHSGSIDGYQSDEIYLPNKDIFVVTLFNGFELNMNWIELSNDIARIAIGNTLRQDNTLSDESVKEYTGTYFFNSAHQLLITFENRHLFVEAFNPQDRLPRVQLYAKKSNMFYIKEANLEFEFAINSETHLLQLTTYNDKGKDAEWKKIK